MYALDPFGWYAGQVADGTPGAVSVAPPIASTATTRGEPRALWRRTRWYVLPYEPPPSSTPLTGYAYNAAGWYDGEVPVGTVDSVLAMPPIASTTTTVGEPRARWTGSAWTVRPYAAQPRWVDALPREYFVIDVGAFFDRLPLAKQFAVMQSADATVLATIRLLTVRNSVYLKAAALSAMLDEWVTLNLITAAHKATMLDPVTTEAERVTKGLPQPT